MDGAQIPRSLFSEIDSQTEAPKNAEIVRYAEMSRVWLVQRRLPRRPGGRSCTRPANSGSPRGRIGEQIGTNARPAIAGSRLAV
jgi:hypothetical protein